MKKLFWLAFWVVLIVGGCYQETGGRVDAFPARLQPLARKVKERFAAVGLRLPESNGVKAPRSRWNEPFVLAPGASKPRPAVPSAVANAMVSGSGTVTEVLSDDNSGSRHQRFRLRLSSGENVLVVHNIDLAPRIASLKVGDTVSFHGESASSGVIHWTHRDPQRKHEPGWLRHNGRTYQ